MMFDPFKQEEMKPNEKIEAPQGRLRVLCSAPAALFVSAEGHEALAGFGTAFDLETSQEVTFWVVGDCRVFWEPPRAAVRAFLPDAEIFTNLDQAPVEDGSVLEIRRMMRQAKLQQREWARKQRALLAQGRPKAEPADETSAKPDVEVVETSKEVAE